MTDEHHASHGAAYFAVFIALCCFTAASWVADIIHLENRTLLAAIVLAIATAKALCVMMYFMHLKFERAWKYLLLAPTFILAAGMMMALVPDIGRHYYTVDAPQVHEYEAEQKLGSDHVGEHH
jgi:cytochrome c oxidase subunit 4